MEEQTVESLSVELSDARTANAHLAANFGEAIAELELAVEDRGWNKSGSGADMRNFSRAGLRIIARESFLFQQKNPIVHRAANLLADYTFGLGVTIKSDHPDVDTVVQEFMADPKNKAELTTVLRMAATDIDLQIDANLFVRFFISTKGRVRVRCIAFDEIEDVITDPEDCKTPWFYVRKVPGESTKYVAYPDWKYRPADKTPTVKVEAGQTIDVDWTTPIYHIKTNARRGQKFGTSELYPAQDWARAHNSFLTDWSIITKSYARLAWDVVKKGNAAARAALKAQLDSGISTDSRVPSPATGSMALHDEDTTIRPLKTAGATTKAEDGRRLLLQACAALGWPETFFGDVSVGSLATAKSLDRPTELRCLNRQRLWAEIWTEILTFVAMIAGEYGIEGLKGGWGVGEWGEPEWVWMDDPESTPEGEEVGPLDPSISVTFPDLVERDMKEAVEAAVAAAPFLEGEFIAEALLHILGEKDVEEILERMFPDGGPTEEENNLRDAVKELSTSIQQGAVDGEEDKDAVVGAMAEAFVEAIRRLQEDKNE